MAKSFLSVKTVLVLLFTLSAATDASARDAKQKRYENISLSALRAQPTAYIDKRLSFDCFFAMLGEIYQPFQTPFVAENFMNFHVWSPETKLWNGEDRKKAFLFCYIPRDAERHVAFLMSKKMYDSVRIFGRVRVVYAGQPWFEVDEVKPLSSKELPSITDNALQHIMVGIKSIKSAQFDMAQDSFRQALKAGLLKGGLPKAAQEFAQRELGKAYYELGKYADAAQALKEAMIISPNDPWILLKRGQSLSRAWRKGEGKDALLREAETLLVNAKYLAPNNPEIYAEIGWVKAKLGQPFKGIADVNKAIALKPTAASYRILGQIRIMTQSYDDAAIAYDNAILRDYKNPLYHREVADQLFMQQGKYDRAITEYTNLIGELEGDPEGNILRAKAYLKRGAPGDIEKAIADYNYALKLSSENLDALLGLAEVYRSKKDFIKAHNYIEQARRFAPKDIKVLAAFADGLRARGDYESAIIEYNEIIKSNPKGSRERLYYGLGICYLSSEKPNTKLAQLNFILAQKANDKFAEAYGKLGEVYIMQGKFAHAITQFRTVKKLLQGNTKYRLMLAKALANNNDPKKAINELEQLCREQPGSKVARLELAKLLLDYGTKADISEGGILAHGLFSEEESNHEYADLHAWAVYKNNVAEAPRAKDIMQMAFAGVTITTPEPYYHMAKIALEMAEYDVAEKRADSALEIINTQLKSGALLQNMKKELQKIKREVLKNQG